MTKSVRTLLALGFTSVLVAVSSIAQPVVTIDENGHGRVTSAGNPNGTPLAFGVAPDPISHTPTLYYVLPWPVNSGDVLVTELGSTNISDLLRFQGNQVWVFSELEPGEPNPDLADVPVLPPPFGQVVGPIAEDGPEGN